MLNRSPSDIALYGNHTPGGYIIFFLARERIACGICHIDIDAAYVLVHIIIMSMLQSFDATFHSPLLPVVASLFAWPREAVRAVFYLLLILRQLR